MVLLETIFFEKGRKTICCNILLICLLPFILYIFLTALLFVFENRGKLRYFLWHNQFVWSNLFFESKSEFDVTLMDFINFQRSLTCFQYYIQQIFDTFVILQNIKHHLSKKLSLIDLTIYSYESTSVLFCLILNIRNTYFLIFYLYKKELIPWRIFATWRGCE